MNRYVVPASNGEASLEKILLSGQADTISIDYGFKVHLETLRPAWSAPKIRVLFRHKTAGVALDPVTLMSISSDRCDLLFSFLHYLMRKGRHLLDIPPNEKKTNLILGLVEETNTVLFIEYEIKEGKRFICLKARRMNNLTSENATIVYFG